MHGVKMEGRELGRYYQHNIGEKSCNFWEFGKRNEEKWCRKKVSDGFKVFQKLFTIINFLFASWNYLLIFKMLTKTLLRNPLSVTGPCSLVPTSHWLQGKCTRLNFSQAASGMYISFQKNVMSVSTFFFKFNSYNLTVNLSTLYCRRGGYLHGVWLL